MGRIKVNKNDAGYYFLNIGRGWHYKVEHKLWINKQLIQKEEKEGEIIEFIEFPVKDAVVVKTEKGNYVLKPQQGVTTYDAFISCGYRGDGYVEVEGDIIIEVPYEWYESERGNLGISRGVIVSAKGPILIKWERTGRLYGDPPTGAYWLYPDGTTKEELLDEGLKNELE